jgi:glycogen debranching enzyme
MTYPSRLSRVPEAVQFGREICRHTNLVDQREWLVTNGLGSYASTSVSGALTRSYHGLLVAAIAPPGERLLLLSHLDETVEQEGIKRLDLSANLWQQGGAAPDAARSISRFELVAGHPRWLFAAADLLMERLIWMEQGANTTFVRYRLLEATSPVLLRIRALVNQRSFHGGDLPADLRAISLPRGVRVQRGDDDPAALELMALPESDSAATSLVCEVKAVPYLGYWLPREQDRGLRSSDQHLLAMELSLTLQPGEAFTLRAHAASPSSQAPHEGSGSEAWQRRLNRQQGLLQTWRAGVGASVAPAPAWIEQLVLAADQFLVSRPAGNSGPARSVIAGYHWFQDWGRDTLISLPGLTLSTGRTEVARALLLGFGEAFDRGMLPNRFPEQGRPLEEADFNTVDAGLWYFEGLRQYVDASGDLDLAAQLHGRLTEVLEQHLVGTRFNIAADPADGLLRCGAPGVQLTWMDAIAAGRVITPRRGKPVEINALWLNALATMADLSRRLGRPAESWQERAERVRSAFQRFWNPATGCCFDVIDAYDEQPGDRSFHDASIRPNQVFAVSLPQSGLSLSQQQAVVQICGRELLTDHGLRSLSPADPAYAGHYGGGPTERDSRYHQGTVWGWLLGPYALAHFRSYGNRERALSLLDPIGQHLLDAGLGSVSEIFDGDAPHAPDGCIAQAWSVAEVLRCWQSIAATPLDGG